MNDKGNVYARNFILSFAFTTIYKQCLKQNILYKITIAVFDDNQEECP